jgi:cyclase
MFSGRFTLDDGTERLEIMWVDPSRSEGGAFAYLPKHKILTTGDFCVNRASGNNLGEPDSPIRNPVNQWMRCLPPP